MRENRASESLRGSLRPLAFRNSTIRNSWWGKFSFSNLAKFFIIDNNFIGHINSISPQRLASSFLLGRYDIRNHRSSKENCLQISFSLLRGWLRKCPQVWFLLKGFHQKGSSFCGCKPWPYLVCGRRRNTRLHRYDRGRGGGYREEGWNHVAEIWKLIAGC